MHLNIKQKLVHNDWITFDQLFILTCSTHVCVNLCQFCITQHDLKKVSKKVAPNDALKFRTTCHMRSYFDI